MCVPALTLTVVMLPYLLLCVCAKRFILSSMLTTIFAPIRLNIRPKITKSDVFTHIKLVAGEYNISPAFTNPNRLIFLPYFGSNEANRTMSLAPLGYYS